MHNYIGVYIYIYISLVSADNKYLKIKYLHQPKIDSSVQPSSCLILPSDYVHFEKFWTSASA